MLKKLFLKISTKPGYFILIDMLITLTLSSFCLMMIFSGLERIETFKRHIDELVEKRNQFTQVMTSKGHYIQTSFSKKDRSYEIFPDVFVDIYQFNFNQEIQKKYGVKVIEFGIVDNREGE